VIGENLLDAINISLRVYYKRGLAIMGNISAVSEGGRIDIDYFNCHFSPFRGLP
jgi:hypothetical protein